MPVSTRHDAWSAGDSYEYNMGRWSRAIAAEFVAWLDQPADLDWLGIGSGTGALSTTILDRCKPRSVLGVDPSEGFVMQASEVNKDARARFEVADAETLPCADHSVDVVTSALAYNFVTKRAEGAQTH